MAGPSISHGMVSSWLTQASFFINLHKPKTVEVLTRRALELGWSAQSPMLIEDGFSFVLALPSVSQQLIDENRTSPCA